MNILIVVAALYKHTSCSSSASWSTAAKKDSSQALRCEIWGFSEKEGGFFFSEKKIKLGESFLKI